MVLSDKQEHCVFASVYDGMDTFKPTGAMTIFLNVILSGMYDDDDAAVENDNSNTFYLKLLLTLLYLHTYFVTRIYL